MSSSSIAQFMPIELVDIITAYIVEFHRVDAIQRVNDMRKNAEIAFSWSLVMGDVRTNIPRYTLTLTGYEGQPISIYCPDCTIHYYLRLMARSTIRRRALSIHQTSWLVAPTCPFIVATV